MREHNVGVGGPPLRKRGRERTATVIQCQDPWWPRLEVGE
jgi:hypothetical protein